MQVNVDFSKVTALSNYVERHVAEKEEVVNLHEEAKEHLEFYD